MSAHAAIVIHGIGQEQRYEIMDDFIQGLKISENVRSVEVVFPRAQRGEAGLVTHAMRVTFDGATRPALDVFEVYWAPFVKGRTTVVSLLGWLLLNTFIPGRMLRFPSTKSWFVLSYIMSALVLVAAALGAITYFLVVTAEQLTPGLREGGIFGLLQALGWWRFLLTAVGAYLALQAFYRIGELYKDVRGPQPPDMTPAARTRETLVDIVLFIVFGTGFGLLRVLVRTPFYDFGLAYSMYSLVALGLRSYFVNYIGDVQVYVTRDENSSRYAARVAVLSQAVEIIETVLRSPEHYERVVLLGHSLGSVVGLDAIRELAARVNAGELPSNDFNRLSTFVTFGSPLEKTLFFFGRGSPRDDGGTSHFVRHVKTALSTRQPRIAWCNGWYFRDIVADPLTSYDAVTNWALEPRSGRSALYLTWVHSDYLSDKAFMDKVVALL